MTEEIPTTGPEILAWLGVEGECPGYMRKLIDCIESSHLALSRYGAWVDTSDSDAVALSVEGEVRYFRPKKGKVAEFFHALLLLRQTQIAIYAIKGANADCAHPMAPYETLMKLGEQRLLVERWRHLQDGARVDQDRRRSEPLFDHDEVRHRVSDVKQQLNCTKSNAVKEVAKSPDMPSVRQIWRIL